MLSISGKEKSTELEKFIAGFAQVPKVAILMSGGGSNARTILMNRSRYANINFVAVVTDQPKSNAAAIAAEFNLKYIQKAGSVKTADVRDGYFQDLAAVLKQYEIDYVLYAGFMKIATKKFVESIPGLNMHPSDLTIVDVDGVPKYRGMNAIPEAVAAGETYIASTLYLVDHTVDAGAPLAVSRHVQVTTTGTQDTDVLHEQLKMKGEHVLFPQMLELLALGVLKTADLPLLSESSDLSVADNN